MAANEGIMALPEAAQMEQMVATVPSITPEDAQDAVNEALMEVSPAASAAVGDAMSPLVTRLMQLPPEALQSLLNLVLAMREGPEYYGEIVKRMIDGGLIQEGDFPPEYDPSFVATLAGALLTASRAMNIDTTTMEQPPVGFARGGIAEAARVVAAQGRGQDKILAHINPQEAAMLARTQGGRINPVTGLPEFGLFKWIEKQINKIGDAIGDVVRGVGDAVGDVIKGVGDVVGDIIRPVVNGVKDVLKSPIGRIAATVALAYVIGPAALGFTSAAAAAPIAAGTVTALSGGSAKDVLKSAAFAYLASPAGPVAGYVGNAAGAMGVSNLAAQAAINQGLTTTAAGLLTGQSLEDSVKAGLVTGAAAGAADLMKAPVTTAEGVPVAPGEALTDQQWQDMLSRGPGEGPMLPGQTAQQAVAQATQGATAPVRDVYTPQDVSAAPSRATPGFPEEPGLAPVETAVPSPVDPAQRAAYQADIEYLRGRPLTPVETATPKAPGVMASVSRAGEGIGDILQGNFQEGFQNLGGGLGDLFMPEGEAGFLRTYGPGIVAGTALLGATGGFEKKPIGTTPLEDVRMGKSPGQELIEKDPSQYLIQNLPGVVYDERGMIIGVQPRDYSGIDLSSVQVRTPGLNELPAPYQPPPVYTPPTGGLGAGRPVDQPYNTPYMYTNLMRTRGYADGGIVGYASGGAVLTPAIARDLMIRSMTTGAPTSEFNKYGGYDKVAAMYQQQGGTYDLTQVDKGTLSALAQQVAATGVGNLAVLDMTGTPMTTQGVMNMVKNGISEDTVRSAIDRLSPSAPTAAPAVKVGGAAPILSRTGSSAGTLSGPNVDLSKGVQFNLYTPGTFNQGYSPYAATQGIGALPSQQQQQQQRSSPFEGMYLGAQGAPASSQAPVDQGAGAAPGGSYADVFRIDPISLEPVAVPSVAQPGMIPSADRFLTPLQRALGMTGYANGGLADSRVNEIINEWGRAESTGDYSRVKGLISGIDSNTLKSTFNLSDADIAYINSRVASAPATAATPAPVASPVVPAVAAPSPIEQAISNEWQRAQSTGDYSRVSNIVQGIGTSPLQSSFGLSDADIAYIESRAQPPAAAPASFTPSAVSPVSIRLPSIARDLVQSPVVATPGIGDLQRRAVSPFQSAALGSSRLPVTETNEASQGPLPAPQRAPSEGPQAPLYAPGIGSIQFSTPFQRQQAQGLAGGGTPQYPRMNGQINGPGTETSDSIPAMLSDGEFVMTARAVRGAGNGDRRKGAKRMYALMHQLERNASRG